MPPVGGRVKLEPKPSVVKTEPSALASARAKVKEEDEADANKCKVEAAKLEAKAEWGIKAEPRVKTELGIKTKLEPKLEGGVVSDLLARGQLLRAKAEAAAKVKTERKVKVERNNKTKAKVKREPGTRGKRKRSTGKRRVTAARRNASRETINRKVGLSEDLAHVLGADAMSRPEAVKCLWAHCRERGMLNPDDKREIIFDDQLLQLFGKPTARMTELMGLLVPHFDYTREVACAKNEARSGTKHEPGASQKLEIGAARAKIETFEADFEAKLEHLMASEMAEPTQVKAEPSIVKRAKVEPLVGSSGAKLEQENYPSMPAVTAASLEQAAAALAPRLMGVTRTSATVAFEPSSAASAMCLVAVATPLRRSGGTGDAADTSSICECPCSTEFREGPEGDLRPYAEARLTSLDPAVAYSVSVDVRAQAPSAASSAAARSIAISVPQRAEPARWSPNEAALWCASLQVPMLVRQVEEYAIDGATLLALEGEDLQALGLAPFLQRRVLTALEALRKGE